MPDGMQGCWAVYTQGVGVVERIVSRQLGRLGAFVSRNPLRTMAVSLIISIGLSAGLARIPSMIENDSDKLWVPQGSDWKKYEDYLEPRLGQSDRQLDFAWEPVQGSNVLTVDSIREMFRTVDIMYSVTYEKDGMSYDWNSICWQRSDGTGCRSSGILRFFNDSSAAFEAVVARGDDAVMAAISAATYPDGTAVQRERVYFAPVTTSDTDVTGTIVSAEITAQRYRGDPMIDDDIVEGWGNELEDVLLPALRADAAVPFVLTRPLFTHPTSVDNAIGESVGNDIFLVVIAVLVIVLLTTLALSVGDPVFTRSTLGLCGILSVVLSIGAAYGFAVLIGIPFTSLAQLLPFILLGIGIDDMFVLVRAMEEVDERFPGLPEEERFRRCLHQGGMSITVTSLTNVAAFLFGSLTTIPSVRWFCWYAALGIAFDWALQITFFLACFVMQDRRIAAGRYDFLCCLTRSPAKTIAAAAKGVVITRTESGTEQRTTRTPLPLAPQGAIAASQAAAAQQLSAGGAGQAGTTSVSEMVSCLDVKALLEQMSVELGAAGAGGKPNDAADDGTPLKPRKVGLLSASKDSFLQWLLNRFFLTWLLHPATRAVVILLALAGAGAGIWAITDLDEGLELSSLAPDGHYLKDFDAVDQMFNSQSGNPTNMYFRYIDQSDPSQQRKMLDALVETQTAGYRYIDNSVYEATGAPSAVWLTAFHAWVTQNSPADAGTDGTIAQANFYANLDAFLAEQPSWREDIERLEDGQIELSSFEILHTGNPGNAGSYERRLLNEVLDVIDDVNARVFAVENDGRGGTTRVVFLSAPYYIYWETSRVIFTELATNLGFALLGVAVIGLVFLVHPWAVAIVLGGVVLVDLLLFLEMRVLGIAVNTISVVNLVMAVGLAVDYSLHVVHTFLCAHEGTRTERARRSMLEIGAAVLIGALSTFVGVIALSGSSSEIFRTFFALLFGTVLFGALVGLVLMPVVLSLVGPQACLREPLELEGSTSDADEGNAIAEAAEMEAGHMARALPATVSPVQA